MFVAEWTKRGIVGRGVLIDYHRYAQARGIEYDPLGYHKIPLSTIKAIAQDVKIEFRPGDILFLRTGYVKRYEGASNEELQQIVNDPVTRLLEWRDRWMDWNGFGILDLQLLWVTARGLRPAMQTLWLKMVTSPRKKSSPDAPHTFGWLWHADWRAVRLGRLVQDVLRCNRKQPCQNCLTRNEQTSCKYKGTKPVLQQDERDVLSTDTENVHHEDKKDSMPQRIDRLEAMVRKLVRQRHSVGSVPAIYNGSVSTPSDEDVKPLTPMSDLPDTTNGVGTTVIDRDYSLYRVDDEWHGVLREINELKKAWTRNQDMQDLDRGELSASISRPADGTGLLFGHVEQIDKDEMIATLPPKDSVDKLIAQFFDRQTFPISIAPILHEPTFMREYNGHWRDPSRTHVIWLGLLFSMLGITMLAYHQFDEPPEYEGVSESLFHLYRLRTAQCLIAGDIAKCLPYTLETLRFNATAELNRKDDNGRSLWIMAGVMVRVAVNMGYHRDPSHSPSISPLKAEYRRRVWLSINSMDDVASFQVGFPRMAPAISSDTLEPRNLHDWELSDEMAVLPTSRPLAESTPTTYLIVKGRLFRALGCITDFKSTIGPSSYETVISIDSALHDAYQSFPPHMKIDYVPDDTTSSPGKRSPSASSNFSLECMYHYGMLTLHRKFFTRGRREPYYAHSRDHCLPSALTLLNLQEQIQPSWYNMMQTRHILSLAALIILLELEHRRRESEVNNSEGDTNSRALFEALERSLVLWNHVKNSCDEAGRIHRILSGMLSSFHASSTAPSQTQTQDTLDSSSKQAGPSHSSHSTHNGTSLEWGTSMDFNFSATDSGMDLDWATWDTFIEGAALDMDSAFPDLS